MWRFTKVDRCRCWWLPHGIMWKIRDLTFTCPLCNVDFETENAFTFHLADQHPDGGSLDESLEKFKTFNNLLFISGLGHLEMKIVNCLFTLLWYVGLESLAKLLGFKSPIAYIYCKKASDHHKSFTILSISMGWLMSWCYHILNNATSVLLMLWILKDGFRMSLIRTINFYMAWFLDLYQVSCCLELKFVSMITSWSWLHV